MTKLFDEAYLRVAGPGAVNWRLSEPFGPELGVQVSYTPTEKDVRQYEHFLLRRSFYTEFYYLERVTWFCFTTFCCASLAFLFVVDRISGTNASYAEWLPVLLVVSLVLGAFDPLLALLRGRWRSPLQHITPGEHTVEIGPEGLEYR